ncbi:MAG: hypothetical protein ACOC44_13535 [Promethearchaeia archaeon]
MPPTRRKTAGSAVNAARSWVKALHAVMFMRILQNLPYTFNLI